MCRGLGARLETCDVLVERKGKGRQCTGDDDDDDDGDNNNHKETMRTACLGNRDVLRHEEGGVLTTIPYSSKWKDKVSCSRGKRAFRLFPNIVHVGLEDFFDKGAFA